MCICSHIVVELPYPLSCYFAGYIWYSLLHCGSPCGMLRQLLFSCLRTMLRFVSSGYLSLVPHSFCRMFVLVHVGLAVTWGFIYWLICDSIPWVIFSIWYLVFTYKIIRTSISKNVILLEKVMRVVKFFIYKIKRGRKAFRVHSTRKNHVLMSAASNWKRHNAWSVGPVEFYMIPQLVKWEMQGVISFLSFLF